MQDLRESAWRAIRWPEPGDDGRAALRALARLDAAEAGDAEASRWVREIMSTTSVVERDGCIRIVLARPLEASR